MSPKATITEKQLTQTVRQLARTLGFLEFHPYDSRRSTPGFPDLVLVGRGRVLYRELKTETGRVSPEQKVWLDALQSAGQDAGIWRPPDLYSGLIAKDLQS